MKTIRGFGRIAIIVLGLSCLPAPACWVEPPEYRVEPVDGGEYFLRNIKSSGTVEVRRARDLKLHWKARIEGYDSIFSTFKLSPDGKRLAHVKGNHMVDDVNQVCVDVYGMWGYRDSYKVSELRNSLPRMHREGDIVMSTDPVYVWFLDVHDPVDEDLDIRLDEKRTVRLSMVKHDVTKLEPCR